MKGARQGGSKFPSSKYIQLRSYCDFCFNQDTASYHRMIMILNIIILPRCRGAPLRQRARQGGRAANLPLHPG